MVVIWWCSCQSHPKIINDKRKKIIKWHAIVLININIKTIEKFKLFYMCYNKGNPGSPMTPPFTIPPIHIVLSLNVYQSP